MSFIFYPRYECTQQDESSPPRYSWRKEVSPLCCQTCNGTVVPGGTVVGVEEIGDKCGAVKTSVCKIRNRGKGKTWPSKPFNPVLASDGDKQGPSLAKEQAVKKEEVAPEMVISAAIEEEYHYKNCCADENGEFRNEKEMFVYFRSYGKILLNFQRGHM